MAEGEADETIRTRFIIDAAKAITDAQKFRDEVNATKDQLRQMADSGKQSLNDLATAMLNLAKQTRDTNIQSLKDAFSLSKSDIATATDQFKTISGMQLTGADFLNADKLKEGIAIVRQQYTDTAKTIRTAFQEVKAEEKDYAKSLQEDQTNATKAASAAQQEYIRVTKQGYGTMSEDAKAYGATIASLKTQIQQIATSQGTSFSAAGDQLVAQGANIKDVNVALGELNATTQNTTGSFFNLGRMVGYIFGGSIAYSALQWLRQVTQYFKDAAQSGVEFAQAMYQLGVGVNVLQRSGIDITIQDVYQNMAKLRQEFGTFTTKELVTGSAALLNLVRDFGLTKDQIFQLQNAVATLAIVNGKSMDEVQRTVALALSSGYTEGLQRLGVSINRVTIALEAQRLGWGRNYMSLTEQQRAIATYDILLQKTAKYQDDLQQYQNTAPGMIAKGTSAWQEFTNVIGSAAVPLLAALGAILERVSKGLEGAFGIIMIKTIIPQMATLYAGFSALTEGATRLWKALHGDVGALTQGPGLIEYMKQQALDFQDILRQMFLPQFFPSGTDQQVADQMDKIQQIIENHYDDINQIQQDATDRSAQIELDYTRRLEQIDQADADKRAQLALDLQRDIVKINEKESQDITDAYTKYYRDLAKMSIDTNNKISKSNTDYHEKERKAEEQFQEQMRKLREQFLLDLDEALRTRDARQVLQLTKRFNLQSTQLTRENNQRKADDARQHALDLADLEQSQADQRAARYQDLQNQLYDIRLGAARQRTERAIQYSQQIADQNTALAQQRRDAQTARDQQFADLQADLNKQVIAIAQSLTQELSQYSIADSAIRDMLTATFGPGGYAEQIFKYYAAMRQGYLVMGGTLIPTITLPQYGPPTPPQAGGGTLFANKATSVMFGEAGPEMATFTPLSKMNANNSSQANLSALFGGKSVSVVRIQLSPGLEANIVNKAMDGTAQIILENLK